MGTPLILAALTLGFTTGFHCIGMCGPIALSLGLSKEQQLNFHLKNLTYQLGRILTYSFLGSLLGIIGEGFNIAGFQSTLTIISGIILIIMAIFSFGGSDFASKIPLVNNFLLKVKINLGKQLARTGYGSRFFTGILNGFLPCGMVYMALTASLASGGVWQGATFMALFGLGTFPFMFLVVVFGSLISSATRTNFLKIMPFIMIVLGGLFILRGLELGIPYLSPPKSSLQIIHNNSDQHHQGDHSSCH